MKEQPKKKKSKKSERSNGKDSAEKKQPGEGPSKWKEFLRKHKQTEEKK